MAKKNTDNVVTQTKVNTPVVALPDSATPVNPPAAAGGGTGSLPAAGLTGLRASLSAMAQGWSTVIPAGTSIPSNIGGYDQTQIVSLLNGWLANYAAADTAKAAATAAVAQVNAQKPAIRAELAQLKSALKAFFGNSGLELAQFGLAPAKPQTKLTSKAMVLKAARAKQTREVLGTLTKKEKAQLLAPDTLAVQVVPNTTATVAPSTAPKATAGATSPTTSG